MARLARGTIIGGDFRIAGDEPLSEGGMGAIYLVEQISTGKTRALKVMQPALVSDAKLRERFVLEARIGAMIESSHIVEVVAAGVEETTRMPWLVMELLEGRDLSKHVENDGPLEFTKLVEVFRQLCHAVGAAHRAGIIHRDLKPENVFLAREKDVADRPVVKVLDFGIAKLVAESGTNRTGAMGTPLWMAPEQTETSVVTAGTDVWAIGLIAFFVLTGRVFWRSGNTDAAVSVGQILREIVLEPIPPASERARELDAATRIPAGFDAWFARCVVRDPTARYANATAAFEAFEVMHTLASPPSVRARAPQPAPSPAMPKAWRPGLETEDEPRPSSREVPWAQLASGSATLEPATLDLQRKHRRNLAAMAGIAALAICSVAAIAAWTHTSPTGGLIVKVLDSDDQNVELAQVSVDALEKCTISPCMVPSLTEGTHSIQVVARGFEAPAPVSVQVDSAKSVTKIVHVFRPRGDSAVAVGAGQPPMPSVGNADAPSTVNSAAPPAGTPDNMLTGIIAPQKTAQPAESAKPASFAVELAAAMGKPKGDTAPASPEGGGAPFNRGAAAAALGAVNVQSCKKPDGPTGSGRVEVTFNPDGSSAAANIIEGPFPGTSVGGCIAGKFRDARVAPFAGAPVHVKKSFTIN